MSIELIKLVNGAGLAMATNDTIALLKKGANANFLDAGGKASPETIKEAFRLVLKNPKVSPFIRPTKVNVILVNIFGGKSLQVLLTLGVIQGDMIATGVLMAMDTLHIDIPVVARIQGTNGSIGMKMVSLIGG
jgi:succinyl-CoA synthetase beta subunit